MQKHTMLLMLALCSPTIQCLDEQQTKQLLGAAVFVAGLYNLVRTKPTSRSWQDSSLLSLSMIGTGAVVATNNTNNALQFGHDQWQQFYSFCSSRLQNNPEIFDAAKETGRNSWQLVKQEWRTLNNDTYWNRFWSWYQQKKTENSANNFLRKLFGR